MNNGFPAFQHIALVKEIESPENPGGLEKRVALIPSDVAKLSQTGLTVYVEWGAGEGVGFSNEEYQAANAVMQGADEIYCDKDLVIKFKGPALASIEQMRPGTTLFCMAHFHSYPDRAALLEQQRINVIAMEEILESPKKQLDEDILGRIAMASVLQPYLDNNTAQQLDIKVIGWSDALAAAIRRSGNRDPNSLMVLRDDRLIEDLSDSSLLVFDSRKTMMAELKQQIDNFDGQKLDIAGFEAGRGAQGITEYRRTHPPLEFGLRRIQCLHETGRAGARYGLKLLQENKPGIDISKAKVIVLGYGNVGKGAIHELTEQGVSQVQVLGRTHTAKGRIEPWLQGVDLVVNGAEQPAALRGKNFLISNAQMRDIIPENSVVIDLVGGSPTNRSPVEAVLNCTFLTAPTFVQDGVSVSSLWGWPMMGMMRETAIRYSGQICDVLMGPEQLATGLGQLAPGVARALMCGPFNE